MEKDKTQHASASHHLEDVKKKLYNQSWKNRSTRVRPDFYSREADIDRDWGKVGNTASTTSGTRNSTGKRKNLVRTFFLTSLFFFVVAIGVSVYILSGGSISISSNRIDIVFEGPASVSGGDDVLLRVNVTNNNMVSLEDVNIIISYPSGFYVIDPITGDTMTREFRSIGTLAPGETKEELVRGVVFGSQGAIRDIVVAMEYSSARSSATFLTEETYSLSVDSAPLSVTIDTLDEMTVGQETDVIVTVRSNTETPVDDTTLVLSYPPGFIPSSAEPVPTEGNHVWYLGTLSPGDEREIHIRGTMHGVHNEEKTFLASLGIADENVFDTLSLVFNETLKSITVQDLFLGVSLSLNGDASEGVPISSEKEITGLLSYVNNLPVTLHDAVFEIQIDGDIIDKYEVTAEGGFYDSYRNVIVWDSNTSDIFETIDPGQSGTLRFSFATKSLVSQAGVGVRNPEAVLSVSVGAIRESEGSVNEHSDNVIVRHARVKSDALLSTRASYATGSIVNTGPLPPIAETETTYTVTMIMANTSNDVRNAVVTGRLPAGVSWKDTKTPSDARVSYNTATREVTWSLGTIEAGEGIERAGPEVSFQVGLTPSVSQIGSTPELFSDIVVTGYDAFVDTTLRIPYASVDTADINDPGFNNQWSRVVAQ